MFTSDLRESREARVCISEVSPWTLKRVIEYAYSGRIAITDENAQELLAAGSLFEYPDIVGACCEFLRRQLDHNNCLGIERFAQVHSCKELQTDAHKYTLENFSMVVKSDEFLELSPERLLIYISSDLIDVRKEEIVYDAVIRWVRYDLDDRSRHLTSLLQQVRLPIVELSYLREIEADPLIYNQPDCLDLIREAQVQHESVSNQQGKRRRSMQNNNVHPRPSTVAKEALVVVGGLNNYITRSVEMYDLQKDRWTNLPDIPQPISQYSVAMLTNALIVSGGICDGHIVDTVWRFDALKLEWKNMQPMLRPRARHASTSINDYVVVFAKILSVTLSACLSLSFFLSFFSFVLSFSSFFTFFLFCFFFPFVHSFFLFFVFSSVLYFFFFLSFFPFFSFLCFFLSFILSFFLFLFFSFLFVLTKS
ncbi:KLHL21 [Acanthosepion pharaonis]|uniref:KLHL21 n=1 Tax=Acanthosepion pharaonis TaxID=158019 RepID=A0A812DHF4_ACAPH|nr:KLHL21 [Sepia pharaonis]